MTVMPLEWVLGCDIFAHVFAFLFTLTFVAKDHSLSIQNTWLKHNIGRTSNHIPLLLIYLLCKALAYKLEDYNKTMIFYVIFGKNT